jgi:hypothetical protein
MNTHDRRPAWAGLRFVLVSALIACTEPTANSIAPDASIVSGSASAPAPGLEDAGPPSRLDDAATHANADAAPGSAHAVTVTVGSGLPCEIERILRARCAVCHAQPPSFGAPMALTSLSDLRAPSHSDRSRQVHELVEQRINATTGAMPPPSSSPLTDAERVALNGWFASGLPAGECAVELDAGATTSQGDAGDVSDLECHKFLAHAPGDKGVKYKVGAAVDSYVNMTFSAGWQGVRYGAVIRPVVDNMRAIHHWLLYEELGADGSVEPGIGQHPSGNMVAGWAPGGPNYDFRQFGDMGLELPGTSYVLELHYNSSDASAEDASGVEICLAKTTPANIVTNSWLGYDNSLLAGDLEGPRTSWTGTCAPSSPQPIHILYVTPHMHLTGRHLRAIINEVGGGQRTLHDAPFDFAYQTTYEKRELLMPGETITTTCTFSEPQSFGQGTHDEMCYLFTYAYPKNALSDNGLWGSFAHGAGVCLGQ